MSPTRRACLRSLAAVGSLGLAGCAGDPLDAPGSVTPAPVPTDSPTATPTPPPGRPPRADELGFWVEARDGFSPRGPARLEISLWNAGSRLLTVLDGPEHAVPFVDDDYAGVDPLGRPGLLLVPDDSGLRVDPEGAAPGPIEAFLPDAPDDGCWRVPFDWPAARGPSTAVLHAVPLEPGEIRRHEYRLYHVGDCAAGTYRFEHTFDLAAGDPPIERDLARARTGFECTVAASGDVRVDVAEPRVTPPGG